MSESVQPIEQRDIDFYGDTIVAVKIDDGGTVYVSVRHVCDALGLNTQAQTRRLERHNVFSDGFMVAMMDTIKGMRPSKVLRVDLLPMWLATIDTSRVNEEVRPKLEQFQREAAKVLWEAFGQNKLAARPDETLLQSDSPEGFAYRQALAVAQIARQQYYMRVDLDKLKEQVGGFDERLSLIEADLGNDKRFVTKEQATNISQAVRAIALVLTKRSDKNEYGRVYGELYRYVGVSSYKEVPAARYEKAMSWLRNWYVELTDESDTPF